MTNKIYEVSEIICDDCGNSESTTISPDYSITDQEESFFYSLKKDGWIYDKGNDEHLCPACVKVQSCE